MTFEEEVQMVMRTGKSKEEALKIKCFFIYLLMDICIIIVINKYQSTSSYRSNSDLSEPSSQLRFDRPNLQKLLLLQRRRPSLS